MGIMAGGLAVIGDISKRDGLPDQPVVETGSVPSSPNRVLEKNPPSAELRPGQTDQEVLPPMTFSTPFLHRHIDCFRVSRLISSPPGIPRRPVHRVLRMVQAGRVQAPAGRARDQVTGRAFGADWRMTINRTAVVGQGGMSADENRNPSPANCSRY